MKSAAKKKTAPQKKKKFCLQSECAAESQAGGYCRLHYIANWKRIKLDKQIKSEQRLNAYVDKLVKKYPKDYLDKIKENLEDEGKFKETVQELDVDMDSDYKESDNEFLEKFLRDIKGDTE